MNQPGVYLVHLAVMRLVGDGDLAWRLVDLAWLALTAVAIVAFARPWGAVASWGAALAFAAYHLASGAWHAGQRDFMLSPFLVAGALGVARWLEAARMRPAALVQLALGGLALGVAVTMKPHTVVLGAALALVAALSRHRAPERAAGVAVYAGAAAVAPAAVLAWLASSGALGAWWAIVRDYLLPLYSQLTRPDDWDVYRWGHWAPLALAVVVSLASAAVSRRWSPRHTVAVAGLGYGLVHFFGQRKGWEYHLYPLAVFATLLAFSEIDRVLRTRAWAVAGPLVASLIAIVVLLGVKGVETVDAHWVWDKERVVRLLTEDLRPHLGAGDTVQVLDTTEGGIHALLRLRRAPPTRFIYDFHFHHHVDTPTIQRLRAEFVRDLAAHPPGAVVVFARGWPAGGYDRIDRFPELAALLSASYDMVQERPAYTILAKRHRP
ncbi:MAG: hypothetical protein HYU51_07110 [Candidatus Rokubacteria bacterium]|nr:hypothetical protein [Candidatus Rokubacteria bacterium]